MYVCVPRWSLLNSVRLLPREGVRHYQFHFNFFFLNFDFDNIDTDTRSVQIWGPIYQIWLVFQMWKAGFLIWPDLAVSVYRSIFTFLFYVLQDIPHRKMGTFFC